MISSNVKIEERMRLILMIVLLIGLVDIYASDGDNMGKDESDPLEFMNDHLNAAKEEFDRKCDTPVTCHDTIQSFRLIRLLGTGAIGRMMRYEHMRTEKNYTVKIMDLGYLQKYNRDNTNLYIFMEYVCGGDMDQLQKQRKKFKERDMKFYAAQLVLALHYLHSMNLIHRDLKLDNVLIDKDGYIKVADFGFATRVIGQTMEKCGTPVYRAPELVLGEPYDKSLDWWMLGTLLYRMSTGEPPFRVLHGDRLSEIDRYIVHGDVNYPSDMSRHLKDLLSHLLAKEPRNRYGLTDVVRHQWFDDIDWKDIYEKKMKAPYIPKC